MAGKSVSFFALCNLGECQLENLSKWLSCNGEIWGIGPTVVFASAAALFLYHELEDAIFIPGDDIQISSMENTLIASMVLGMLSLMVHLWVCLMRFFQYYLDTLIKDSPTMIIEMTTLGLLGSDLVPLGPLMKFLRQQQPQIHITVCWFLALCYADYVRKRYCRRFNMPYLEQWQMEMHQRASRGVSSTIAAVSSFVGCLQQRLRGFSHQDDQQQSNTTLFNHHRREYTVKEQRTGRPVPSTPRQQLFAQESALQVSRTRMPRENSVFTLPLEPCPIVTSSQNRIYFPMEEPLLSRNQQWASPQVPQESLITSEESSRKPDAPAQTRDAIKRHHHRHKNRYKYHHIKLSDYRS